MPKKLHKSIKVYFSKLKKIRTPNLQTHPSNSWLLSACKYPKTPSFTADSNSNGRDTAAAAAAVAATLSDVDRFLYENFHNLYIRDDSSNNDPYDSDPPANVMRSSDRFFVSPGTSNSIIDDSRMSTTWSSTSSQPSEIDQSVPKDSVAVMTFTKDPYEEFRRSMEEMVESRHEKPGQPLDWDFMEELLFCYLELNDRNVHKYILKAFTDLTVSYRRKFPVVSAKGKSRRRRRKVVEVDREMV